jgi:Flp pilus assembly protein TadD
MLHERGGAEGAIRAFRRAAARGYPSGAFNIAVLAHDAGDTREAEFGYREALAGGMEEAAANLALLHEDQGDLASAAELFERAAASDRADGLRSIAEGPQRRTRAREIK